MVKLGQYLLGFHPDVHFQHFDNLDLVQVENREKEREGASE